MAEKIAEAYVEISGRTEKATQAVDRLKVDVDRKVQDVGGGEGGAFDKLLFGRRGPAGVERSVARAIGPLARAFVGGGVFALGAGLAIKLGESLLSSALGFDKMGEAAERNTKRLENYNQAVEELIRLNQTGGTKSPAERLSEFQHPKTIVEKQSERIRLQQQKEDAAAKAAESTTLTKEERNAVVASVYDPETGAGAGDIKDALKKAESDKRERIKRAAIGPGGPASHMADQAILGGRIFGNARGFGEGIGQVAGGEAGAIGTAASFLFGNFLRGGTPANPLFAAQARNQQREPDQLIDRFVSLEDREKEIGRQKRIDALTGGAAHLGGATGIENIGEQIQQAALTPSPHEQEMKRIAAESAVLLTDIKDALKARAGWTAVVGGGAR